MVVFPSTIQSSVATEGAINRVHRDSWSFCNSCAMMGHCSFILMPLVVIKLLKVLLIRRRLRNVHRYIEKKTHTVHNILAYVKAPQIRKSKACILYDFASSTQKFIFSEGKQNDTTYHSFKC